MEPVEVAEDLILDYLFHHSSIDDLKQINNAEDMLNTLTYDAIEEIKDELWSAILNRLNYRFMLERLEEQLSEDSSTAITEEEETEDEEEGGIINQNAD
jgi:regulator of replication initiation timing